EMLARALKNNADISVAEAKVRLAEAELHRTQQAVLGKIVTLYAEIDAASKTLSEAEKRVLRLTQLRAQPGGKSIVTDEEFGMALVTHDKYKAELAVKKAELSVLIGKKTGAAGPGLPKAFAFSPDGKFLVESVDSGGARIWD